MYGDPRDLLSFPTRRSSDLPPLRGMVCVRRKLRRSEGAKPVVVSRMRRVQGRQAADGEDRADREFGRSAAAAARDRKSTRLNSSHVEISYAVFCLKKKKISQ